MQIAFGTTAISLTPEQFYEFQEVVKEYYDVFYVSENYDQKVIHVPTLVQSVYLVYSVNELQILIDMLDKACFELEMANLLDSTIQNTQP